MPDRILTESLEPLVVDLSLPPERRWTKVLEAEHATALALVEAAEGQLEGIPEIARSAFGTLFSLVDGPFRDELHAWAEALEVSYGTLALLNCAYELDHFLFENVVARVFACTAGVVDGAPPRHVRTLDWPIQGMGKATRIIEFRQAQRRFFAIGFPGFVGVLSGMVPGGYSVTINWAPPADQPDFHWGPSFLLRTVLESCDTYAEAVERLSTTRLASSVFFTVCGARHGEACVIERTREHAWVRSGAGAREVQSNHHVAAGFTSFNGQLARYHARSGDPLVQNTVERRANLDRALSGITRYDADDAERWMATLASDEVTNVETVQRMLFCPASGTLVLDRLLEGAPNDDGVWARSSHRWDARAPLSEGGTAGVQD